MKKILLINNGYPTKGLPHHSTYIRSIYRCLIDAGFKVDLLVLKLSSVKNYNKIIAYLIFWWKLKDVKLASYDIIYINHAPFAFPLFLRNNLYEKKLYIHWHGNELVSENFFIRSILNIFKRSFYKCSHIVPSLYFRKVLQSKLQISKEKICVSPSGGVNTEWFKEKKHEEGKKVFVIGFASALDYGKGADVLESIMKHYHDLVKECTVGIIFQIIDYGKDSSFFLKKYHNLNVPLNIIKKCSKSAMYDFYTSIDILLMPSRREGESLGLVALEGMSCGLPVITFDICAFPEFIFSGVSGELVKFSFDTEKCGEEFNNAIVKVIKNYDLYASRKIVLKKYSQDTVVDFYKTLF